MSPILQAPTIAPPRPLGPIDRAVTNLLKNLPHPVSSARIPPFPAFSPQVSPFNRTVWLTRAVIAELYRTTPQNVTQHLAAIYHEGEIEEAATRKDYLQVRREGTREVRRKLKHDLSNTGKVTRADADRRAHDEYARFEERRRIGAENAGEAEAMKLLDQVAKRVEKRKSAATKRKEQDKK